MNQRILAVTAVCLAILAMPGGGPRRAWSQGSRKIAPVPALFIHPNESEETIKRGVAGLVKSPVPPAVFGRLGSLLKHGPVAVVGLGDRMAIIPQLRQQEGLQGVIVPLDLKEAETIAPIDEIVAKTMFHLETGDADRAHGTLAGTFDGSREAAGAGPAPEVRAGGGFPTLRSLGLKTVPNYKKGRLELLGTDGGYVGHRVFWALPDERLAAFLQETGAALPKDYMLLRPTMLPVSLVGPIKGVRGRIAQAKRRRAPADYSFEVSLLVDSERGEVLAYVADNGVGDSLVTDSRARRWAVVRGFGGK